MTPDVQQLNIVLITPLNGQDTEIKWIGNRHACFTNLGYDMDK